MPRHRHTNDSSDTALLDRLGAVVHRGEITDPEALAKPFTSTRLYGRHRDWTLAEYVCQQNNRNYTTDDGKAGINLKH